jgi:RHS repeat-associated protein
MSSRLRSKRAAHVCFVVVAFLGAVGVVGGRSTAWAGNGAPGVACASPADCLSGSCLGGICCQTACAGTSDQCTGPATCELGTGACTAPQLSNQACDDGNSCTAGDMCQSGICVPGPEDPSCTGPKYVRIVDLGAVYAASFANGINNNGEVVGTEKGNAGPYELPGDGGQGFRWSEAEGKSYLPMPFTAGNAINASGVVLGYANGGQDAARYDRVNEGAPVLLGVPYGGVSITGNIFGGINSAGIATGGGYFPQQLSMYRWDGGAPEQLPGLPLDPGWALGLSIAEDNTVVGYEYELIEGFYETEAVRYSDARGPESLFEILPSHPGWSSLTAATYVRSATASTPGVILGHGIYNGFPRAYRLTVDATGAITEIENLGIPSPDFDPDAPNPVRAYQENSSGVVVGSIYEASTYFYPIEAFAYANGRMVNLTSLVAPSANWGLAAAVSINDQGEVVGYGYHNGQVRAFKLTLPDMKPCDAPTNLCQGPAVRDLLTGQCSYPTLPSGTVCRAATGPCDVAETCDGTSLACPADGVQPLGSVCRSAVSVCDVPEVCDGTTKNCPTDQVAPTTTLCRASTSICDAAEYCTGTSSTCPVDGFQPATTVCRPPAGGCDVAETCTGTSPTCPADTLAAAGAVCRPAESLCDVAETCSGTSAACPSDGFAPAGTTCGFGTPAPVCSGTTGTCPVSGTTADILGFEALADWGFASGAPGSVVGVNPNRTEGGFSFEISAHGSARLNSAAMSSIGGVNPILLMDIQLPTSQANTASYGDVQMLVNSPSLGINNVSLGDVNLTGLALGTWQTIAFQVPVSTASAISQGVYSDLTFSIVLNVDANETGHYLLDNIRSLPDVVPALLGLAQEGSTTKAIFDYVTSSSTAVTIPYGTGNGLANANGFIALPALPPPTTFVSTVHAPFVATLSTSFLKWTLGSHSVTATSSSQQLPVTTLGDGTHDATLPDGRKINLDSTPPASPTVSFEPPLDQVNGQYFGSLAGKLSVSPSGAASYTVPISIPPGVAGMAPSVNLTYNSQGRDGIAGQGWDLTGASMIHRCPLTRVQDGIAQPVKGLILSADITDGVCLDGKRLFRVSQNAYKLESEDFSTITKFPSGSDWAFKVLTKTGQARYYGLSSHTQVALPDAGNVTKASVWLLERVVDQWGNYYDLHYDNDDPTRFPFDGANLSSISYTGHLTSIDGDPHFSSYPGTPVSPPNTITFAYEFRSDSRLVRFHYGTLPITKRLTGITTPQGTYALTYYPDDPMLPSRLKTIGFCNGPTSLSTAASTACLDSLEFKWDAGNYGWQPVDDPNVVGQANSYVLPVTLNQLYADHASNYRAVPNGIRFADLDGDGRVDLLVSRDADANYPAAHNVWWNNGKGWTAQPQTTQNNWNLPAGVNIVNSEGGTGAFLVDVDGDGLPDILSRDSQGQLTIWYNRLKLNEGWVQDHGQLISGFPSSWGALYFDLHVSGSGTNWIDSAVDIDGDGRADLVRQYGNSGGQIDVLLNTPSGWSAVDYSIPGNMEQPAPDYWHFSDVNRDGLPDLVSTTGAIGASATLINIGKGALNAITHTHWQLENPNVTLPTYDAKKQHIADVDGDGYYDVVEADQNIQGAVAFGTGSDYSNYTIYPTATGGYATTLAQFIPSSQSSGYQGYVSLADINGDGLADAVVRQPRNVGLWGQLLVNYGPGQGWHEPSGQSPGTQDGYSVPYAPVPSDINQGGAWIDLNGDGLVDIVQSTDGSINSTDCCNMVNKAWLNTFHPPVIDHFPNALAVATTVSYATITTADAQKPGGVYDDPPKVLAPNTSYLAAPVRVVEWTKADAGLSADGTGAKLVTTYHYSSLRGSALGRGPQGFKSVTVTEPSGIVTTTTFSQVYPYTGLPVSVSRSYDVGDGVGTPVPYATTQTTYCAYQLSADTTSGTNPPCISPDGGSVAPQTSLFLYPALVEDTTTLETGTSADRTAPNQYTDVTTSHQYDHHGNPTTTTTYTNLITPAAAGVPTLEVWKSTTVNSYDPEGSDTRLEGKVTQVAVTAQQTAPVAQPARTHTTAFAYQTVSSFSTGDGQEHFFYGIGSKTVEPGAGYPIQLDTAYSYDSFGNVIGTTDCDNGGGGCRTSSASYDPADFVAPQGVGLITSIGYQPGLFPVRQTNAAGQSEYFVYDPILGVVVQHTGPNGITTCDNYDSFGNSTSETARCGSSTPVTTGTSRFRATGVFEPQPATATVTIVRPQTGAATWTYADVFGRTVQALARNLNGSLTEVDTKYDSLGRVLTSTEPTLPGDVSHKTTYQYDGLGRVTQLTKELGYIDDSGQPTSSLTVVTYQGPSVTTSEMVRGVLQQRTETKNGIGKVASVESLLPPPGTDPLAPPSRQVTQYQYDSDGNLTDVLDPNQNDVHTHFDTRGRKDLMTDPDMGTWQYCYDGFGDLVGQIDAKNPGSTCTSGPLSLAMTYDVLGRMTSKTDVAMGNTAQWLYDSASGAGIGKLAAMVGEPDDNLDTCPIPTGFTVTGGNRPVKTYVYNQFGDVQEVDECVDGNTFATTYGYDQLGRQNLVRYPAVKGWQLAVGYHYTNLGFLQYLTDESSDYSVLWQAKGVNGLGQVTDEQMANGVETTSTRNPVTGWLMASASTAHLDGDTLIQNWANTYDVVGNLRTRTRSDVVNDYPSTETFDYDVLNRLLSSRVQLPNLMPTAYDHKDSYGYDGLGNLTVRNGGINAYGTGCVGHAGPHALCTVAGGSPYGYDANGNMTSGAGRSVTYNAANKPTEIIGDSAGQAGTVDFAYGADGNRVLQLASTVSGSSRTVYVGLGETGKSLYERTTVGGVLTHTFFIYAGAAAHGGNAFSVRVLDDSGTKNRYFNFDHLGSTTAVSDDKGHVATVAAAGPNAGVMGYDPWGARRNPDGRAADPTTFAPAPGNREFTAQETIPAIGLVNMNGRVYDPAAGRFLSPDPNVQAPTDLQSYNRYSYVLNNPLRYTDPTGYSSIGDLESDLGVYGSWFAANGRGIFVGAAVIGICTAAPGAGCAAAGLVAALFSAGTAIEQGASWTQAGTGFAISMVAGNLGGAAGSFVGWALDATAGSAADFAAAEIGGAVGGAIGGALSTAVAGGSLGRNVLNGTTQGAAWAAVGWGLKQSTLLTQAEAQGGGSGEASVEAKARVSPDQQTDAVLAAGLYAYDHPSSDPIVLASAQDGAEGHGGIASQAGPIYQASPNPKPFVTLPEPGLISSDPLLGAILFAAGAGEVDVAAEAEGLGAVDSWGSAATLERHFAEHGADVGAASAEGYAREASSFLQRAQAGGLPTRIDADGVIRVYDPATNTFGAFNPNGTTRTFFTPSSPTYWSRQPGAEPWTPAGGGQ